MAENYMDTSFYPHHGPSKYSYTSDFDGDNRHTTALQAIANTSYSGLATQAGNKFKILFNLKLLINGARSAEMAFLASTGIDLSQGVTAKKLFENFNLILNSQEVFERNIALIKQISKDKTTEIEDPSKYFFSYLQDAIQEYGLAENFNIRKSTKKQLADFIDRVVGKALERTYENFKEYADDNGSIKTLHGKTQNGQNYYNAYSEIIDTIRKLQSTGIFYKYSHLFNMDKLLKESADSKGNIINKPTLTKDSFDHGGTVLEFVEATVGSALKQINLTNTSPSGTVHIIAEHTGGKEYNQQKSDVTLGYAVGKVDFKPMKQSFINRDKEGSDRLQNARALDDYLGKVTKAMKSIVFISDKNYKISAKWKGAKAQDAMTLANARSMLNYFGVSGVDALIDYLANCGPDMIQGESNPQVETALAAQIGYYLFDHLEITGNVTAKTNVVNIMNISGLYIPLSVYLEGVYNSLEANLEQPPSSLVSVNISYGGTAPGLPWTVGTWADFRAGRENKTTIKYYILRDINSFITGLMG